MIHNFPDDATDDEISAALDRRAAPASTSPSSPAKRTWTDTARDLIPTAGGTIGAFAGGPLGSAIGGAAGSGYRQLAEHATELPGALADIARNWREAPAMARGFASGAASGAMDAGTQAAIQGASTIAGNAITRGATTAASSLMQSALKPGLKSAITAAKSGKVAPAVQTMLKEGINVTPGGVEKLNRIINATNDDIASALGSLPQKAMSISAKDVEGRLAGTVSKFAQQVNPADDVATITKAGQEFTAAHGPYLTLPEAQAVKTGTYARLGEKAYGEVKTAASEAQKALARGLKEEIEREAQASGLTNISALNAREGSAIVARDEVAKRVAQVANRDKGGLTWLAHSPVTFLLALGARNPAVNSFIARGLYNSAAKASGVPAEAIRWAVGAIASASQENE